MKKQDPIDSFAKFYNEKMPDAVYLQKNGKRYEEVIRAIDEIKNFFKSIEESAAFKVEKDKLIGTDLGLVITCTLLSTTQVEELCNEIKKADNIDIVPLRNGDVQITLGFNDAYMLVPPRS